MTNEYSKLWAENGTTGENGSLLSKSVYEGSPIRDEGAKAGIADYFSFNTGLKIATKAMAIIGELIHSKGGDALYDSTTTTLKNSFENAISKIAEDTTSPALKALAPISVTTNLQLVKDTHEKKIVHYEGAINATITLPNTPSIGDTYHIYNGSSYNINLSRGGTLEINALGGNSLTTISIDSGVTITVMYDGVRWVQYIFNEGVRSTKTLKSLIETETSNTINLNEPINTFKDKLKSAIQVIAEDSVAPSLKATAPISITGNTQLISNTHQRRMIVFEGSNSAILTLPPTPNNGETYNINNSSGYSLTLNCNILHTIVAYGISGLTTTTIIPGQTLVAQFSTNRWVCSFANNYIPAINAIHDIGSPTKKYKDIYLSGGVIAGTQVGNFKLVKNSEVCYDLGPKDLVNGLSNGYNDIYTVDVSPLGDIDASNYTLTIYGDDYNFTANTGTKVMAAQGMLSYIQGNYWWQNYAHFYAKIFGNSLRVGYYRPYGAYFNYEYYFFQNDQYSGGLANWDGTSQNRARIYLELKNPIN